MTNRNHKHTPGPWVLTPGLDVVMSHGDDTFQPVAIANGVKHLRRGDAHLIAAAPDMLEALEDLVEQIDDVAITGAARAAIKKARGEQ